MHKRNLIFKILMFYMSIFPLGIAWKPIVGQQSYTSSFSFQQEHPVLSIKDIATEGKALLESESRTQLSFPNSISDEAKVDQFKNEKLLQEVELNNFGYTFESEPFFTKNTNEKLEDTCNAKKFAFNQDGVVHYDAELPGLEQFTICFWSRFTNHSGDHVLLTYTAKNDPRAIQFWVANSKNSSFISMAIKGQQMYRLNYPLRTRQWHHTCSSWNGKTGEWQIWVKAERIGRGFHNSLVGHKIPAKGNLFSGGNSVTGKINEGLHFEISFIQIYKIALSAGKAHRDHKHHHAHHFDHEGKELVTTTKTPPKINRPQLMNNLLANGQIPTSVRINLATPDKIPTNDPTVLTLFGSSIPSNGESTSMRTNFINGQINAGSRLVTQQLLGYSPGAPQIQTRTTIRTQPLDLLPSIGETKFIDETETHIQFKRQANEEAVFSKRVVKEKNLGKRDVNQWNDGSVPNNRNFNGPTSFFEGLASFGDAQFKSEVGSPKNIDDEIENHDQEPAEEEVRAVMAICTSCDPEPFQGAIVFSWKKVEEKMDNALKGLTMGGCGKF